MLFFRDIIGHKKIISGLKSALASERVAHAYLFWGPEGTGKSTAALAFAAVLLCKRCQSVSALNASEPGVSNLDGSGPGFLGPDILDLEACGQCKDCRQVAGKNHPDLHLVEPQGSFIKIEQVRNLQKKVAYKSYQGKYRVCLIDPADTMTLQAANSLLKILEDPPGDTVFILVSARPYALLPTVLSRCQQVQFKALAPEEVEEGLKREAIDAFTGDGGLMEERLKSLSVMAGGSLGKAISLLRDLSVWEEREEVLRAAGELRRSGPLKALALAEDWARDKEKALRRLEILLYWYRDLLLWKKTGRGKLLANSDLLDFAAEESYFYSGLELVKMIEETEKTLRSLRQNAITRLALEMLFLQLAGGGKNYVTLRCRSAF